MNINDLTIGQTKELASLLNAGASTATNDYPVGKNVIVRTVTMIYTGKLVNVTPTNLVLLECSWIPDTDRYMQFVAEGKVKECEPYPDDLSVYINRGALLDVCELRSVLPRSQK